MGLKVQFNKAKACFISSSTNKPNSSIPLNSCKHIRIFSWMEIIEEESVDDDEEELDDEEDMSIFELLIITEPECFGDSTKGEVLRVLFGEEEALIGFLSC